MKFITRSSFAWQAIPRWVKGQDIPQSQWMLYHWSTIHSLGWWPQSFLLFLPSRNSLPFIVINHGNKFHSIYFHSFVDSSLFKPAGARFYSPSLYWKAAFWQKISQYCVGRQFAFWQLKLFSFSFQLDVNPSIDQGVTILHM